MPHPNHVPLAEQLSTVDAEQQVETDLLPRLSAVIPCEMAIPVSYSPDGQTVESFRPCDHAAVWRHVIRWPELPDVLDEHLLCQQHLELWQTFRAVEHPSWEVVVLARL